MPIGGYTFSLNEPGTIIINNVISEVTVEIIQPEISVSVEIICDD